MSVGFNLLMGLLHLEEVLPVLQPGSAILVRMECELRRDKRLLDKAPGPVNYTCPQFLLTCHCANGLRSQRARVATGAC